MNREHTHLGAARGEPLNPKLPHIIHGADYFPEQWLDDPKVLADDMRLMKRAGINAVSVGMFAWSALEPEEGSYTFEWLDALMDRAASAGIFVLLATPSGGRPAWLSRAYPEVLRVGPERRRNLHGLRHNHCFTSPIYRQKTAAINRMLAERYGEHPALIMWHVSNEYGGECHCPLCQGAFREWLKRRYHGSLNELNRSWWSAFWSNTISDWQQIESPAPHGEPLLQGLLLDWKRFVTDQTVDFMLGEIAPLRELAPRVPVTTNMMGTYPGLNYWKLVPHIDVASWTSYPAWHGTGVVFDQRFPWDPDGRDWRTAAATAFAHDLMRSLKGGKPFMLMESTPTFSNWQAAWKLKRPGMHAASSLLAVAHGSDTVQYFQWRKSRGGTEKFHGAVLGNDGSEATRVFAEVADLGRALAALDGVVGARSPARAAIIYDWENRWALEGACIAPASGEDGYEAACKRHHYPFWAMGVSVDVIDMEHDLSPYRLVVAPMLSMIRPGVVERMERFVREGGSLVATYWSGTTDEHDLCFPGGSPGPLRGLLGLRSEEIDGLYPTERNRLEPRPGNGLGLAGRYQIRRFCELIHPESARVLGTYGEDFYKGRPALTVNELGAGAAYYIAAEVDERFLRDFYASLARKLTLRAAIAARLPPGVCAQLRTDGETEFLFLINFARESRRVKLGRQPRVDLVRGESRSGAITLEPFGTAVLKARAGSS